MTGNTLLKFEMKIDKLDYPTSSNETKALVLLCRMFLEYLKLEMEQHGQELK